MGIWVPEKEKKEKEESDADKVMKGLQVAGQLYGLYTDTQKVQAMKDEATLKDAQIKEARAQFQKTDARAEAKEKREKDEYDAKTSGVLGPKDLAEMEISATPKPGYTQAKDSVTGNTIFIRKRQAPVANPLTKEPTQSQFTAATFGERAQKAEKDFADLKDAGFDRSDRATAAGNSLASIVGLQSGDYRRQQQAERNFVNALLRRESGAAISPSEFQNAEQQYFPRAGDDEATRQQKAENRAIAIAGLQAEGAPAASRVKGQMKNVKSADGTVAAKPESGGLAAGLTNMKKGKPKTVIQNGHTYQLNEKTGEYE
jgi:hypothetical protein